MQRSLEQTALWLCSFQILLLNSLLAVRWSVRILGKDLLCLVPEILCLNHAESHACGDWLISGHRFYSDGARQPSRAPLCVLAKTHSVVLILSNGVTANRDSVIPAPKPAITVLGPEILPNSSCSNVLYVSKATKPSNILVDGPPIPRSKAHTYSSFQRIPNNQGRTSCIPCLPEWRPSKLLPVW